MIKDVVRLAAFMLAAGVCFAGQSAPSDLLEAGQEIAMTKCSKDSDSMCTESDYDCGMGNCDESPCGGRRCQGSGKARKGAAKRVVEGD